MNETKGSILVVDDTIQNLRLLADILSRQGYDVRPARNGNFALRSARAEAPDLILLDIMMPGISGYETCERLKADENTRDIPVIFISALDDTLDKVRAFALGAVDYITKPFQTEEVLARVRTHLNLQSARAQVEVKNCQLQQEITVRKQVEAQLRQQAEELQARNEELDAFAHTVAHNLHGTLSSIIGFAELLELEGDQLTKEQRQRSVAGIANSGRKMSQIISNLLMLAELRKTDAILHEVDMERTVSDAVARLQPMIESFEATICFPRTWHQGIGYAPWIEEVWVNYLSNGIKYGGNPPELVLGSSLLNDGRIKYWVQDNGLGLKEEESSRLFTPFTRLNQVDIKGHGLGLSIVKRIVNKMDGEVDIESEVGKGSIFSFTLQSQSNVC
jgi:signal transduction histidine kinase